MPISNAKLIAALLISLLFLFIHCADGNSPKEAVSTSNSTTAVEQAGYDLSITFKNIKNSECYLGHHFGDKQFIIDTGAIDATGKVQFVSDNNTIGGLYLVLLPSQKYFEFILNERTFSLETDSTDFLNTMSFTGSKENDIFYDDLRFLDAKKAEAKTLNEELKAVGAESDAGKAVKEQLKNLDTEVKAYRANIVDNNPNLFYTKLLLATPDPVVPDPPNNPDGTVDSLFQFNYYKQHFLDDVDFSDARMLNTPVLHKKMTQYLDQLTVQRPDSIVKSAFYIIDEKVKNDQDVFQYVVNYVTSHYEKSKQMGMDEVFVSMVNKYYNTGRAFWIDDTQLYKIKDRAYKLAPLLLGKKAPALNLKDKDGNFVNMYDIDKDVTILYFWDPDCGHCKKMTPILKEFWEKHKHESMTIYASCTEVEKDKWLKYIDENELTFINVGDFELRNTFREAYDIYSTPVVYLLDKDKIIKAKKIGVEQLEQVYSDYKAGKIK